MNNEANNYFKDLIELQSLINEIPNNDFSPEDFETYLSEHSEYLQNKRSALQLFSSLDIFISNYPQHSDYPKKLIISPLLHDTLSLFSSSELYQLFQTYSILFLLYRNGYININTIIERASLSSKEFAYFMYEIQESDQQFFSYSIQRLQNQEFLNEIVKQKEKHLELRIKGRNHHQIAEIIRNDDIQQFQELVSQTNVNLNSKVPYSFYEDCEFINKKKEMPLLIEFAAFFNSINIFKFLWINGIRGTQTSLQFAIAGGNYEIIHLFESVYKNKINSMFLESAIYFNRNDIFSYLQDTYEIQTSIKHFYLAINSYNTEIFVCLLNEAFDKIKKSEFLKKIFFNEKYF